MKKYTVHFEADISIDVEANDDDEAVKLATQRVKYKDAEWRTYEVEEKTDE